MTSFYSGICNAVWRWLLSNSNWLWCCCYCSCCGSRRRCRWRLCWLSLSGHRWWWSGRWNFTGWISCFCMLVTIYIDANCCSTYLKEIYVFSFFFFFWKWTLRNSKWKPTWWCCSQSLCWQNEPQYLAKLQPEQVSLAFRPQFQHVFCVPMLGGVRRSAFSSVALLW